MLAYSSRLRESMESANYRVILVGGLVISAIGGELTMGLGGPNNHITNCLNKNFYFSSQNS